MIIETERLILRPFELKDAADVLEYLEDPEVHCFSDMKLDNLNDAEKVISRRMEEADYYLAVTLKETGKVIGEVFGGPEEDSFSPCWMYNKAYQGKGYAFEAGAAYFDYLFCTCGFRRIYAYTEEDNIKSQGLCRKLGMRHEGTFIEFISFVNNPDGTPLYENTMQFAILKKEWVKMKDAVK